MKGFLKLKEKRGITLIALIITIIVLLILAGVSISMLTGDNGILTQAQNAKVASEISTVEEKVRLGVAASYDTSLKLDAVKVSNSIKRDNSEATVESTVEVAEGEELKFPLKVKVDDVELIVDYDGDVRKPVTNPYDANEWEYAWVCEEGVWSGKNGVGGEEPFTQDDLTTVQEVEDNGGIVAKFYKQDETVTFSEELGISSNNAYHLVIEGTGEMGVLYAETEANGWCLQYLMSEENKNIVPILLYVTEAYICEGITNVGDGCLAFGISINKIAIGNTVTDIKYGAFGLCLNLESIKIPSSVTSIGAFAFQACDDLKSVKIPSSVTSIGKYAFSECYNLTNITIPSSVTSIGTNALRMCNSLKSITYKGTKAQWNEITKGEYWKDGTPIIKIICTDGEITIE